MITANDIKKGLIISLGNGLMKVVVVDHHMSGGKAGAMINTKLKNMQTGHTAEHNGRICGQGEGEIAPLDI